MPILERGCKACGHRFEVLSMQGQETNLDRDDDVFNLSCSKCGCDDIEAFVPLVSTRGRETGSVKFPYFDRGLHRWIRSWEHRAEVCREQGVIPVEDETMGWGEDRFQKEQSQRAADEKKYDAYVEEMTTGPSRGEFHAMMEFAKREREKRMNSPEVLAEGRRQQLEYEEAVEAARRAAHDGGR